MPTPSSRHVARLVAHLAEVGSTSATNRELAAVLGVTPRSIRAVQLKPGSRHRVVRVADVLELEASRRAGTDRIGATIDTLVDAGAEY
jgi:hypothetical protein